VSTTQVAAALVDHASLLYHVTVTNTGSFDSGVAVLAFVNTSAGSLELQDGAAPMPTPPLRTLFNFSRVFLPVGASVKLTFSLGQEALALSDDAGDQAVRPGFYTIAIGGVGRAGRVEDGAVSASLQLVGEPQVLFSMRELRKQHRNFTTGDSK
jgi:hypothetical protein